MNKPTEANLETIHSAMFDDAAKRGRKLIESYRIKGRDLKASRLLRHHSRREITDRETYLRDDVDYLLSYYSIIMVSITAGTIHPKPDDPLLESALECLTYPPLRTYYESNYPLVLPQRLLTWLTAPTEGGSFQVVKPITTDERDDRGRIFSTFLYLTAGLEHDDELEAFLWILDGGWRGDWNYSRLKKVLGDAEKAASLLIKSTDVMGQGLIRGTVKFLQFCCSLDELLSASAAYSNLQEEMYLYHSYWFSASEDLFGRMLELLTALQSVGGNVGAVKRHLKALQKRGSLLQGDNRKQLTHKLDLAYTSSREELVRHPIPKISKGASTNGLSSSHFENQPRVVLPGSEQTTTLGTKASSKQPYIAGTKLLISVIVRRKEPLKAAHRVGKERLTLAQYRASYGVDPTAVKLVHKFAREFGLAIVLNQPSPASRTITLSGTNAAIERAFGITFSQQVLHGRKYRTYDGSIHLPSDLLGAVEAVLGLDNLPKAGQRIEIFDAYPRVAQYGGFARPHAPGNGSYTPIQVAQLYQFPFGAQASSQTIGIISLGGKYRTADIDAYFRSLGRKPPRVAHVSLVREKINSSDDAIFGAMADVEICASVAPAAKIVVYSAPNTEQGFVSAIGAAVHDSVNRPNVILTSWGAPESHWTLQAITAFDSACQSATALGITVVAAVGRNGSRDGSSYDVVDFPASSPHVLACGGTTLVGTGSTISSETPWNGVAKGGPSGVFPLPAWQANANIPKPRLPSGGRGIPDVAANANPDTGYAVRLHGKNMVVGGNGTAASIWAGLIAVANHQNGKPAGTIHPLIYGSKGRSAFQNAFSETPVNFRSDEGWNVVCGLGSPVAPKIISLLDSTSEKPKSNKAKSKPAKSPLKRRALR